MWMSKLLWYVNVYVGVFKRLNVKQSETEFSSSVPVCLCWMLKDLAGLNRGNDI